MLLTYSEDAILMKVKERMMKVKERNALLAYV